MREVSFKLIYLHHFI